VTAPARPPVSPQEYEPVIGLECHIQLHTATKAFTAAATAFGAPPNTLIDPYTLGLPGSLPVLSQRAVEFALRMGLACGCTIRLRSEFARKHYFYPDLPKGYQISQYDAPLCVGGALDFLLHGEPRQVRLVRIHMEEDAGKILHAADGQSSLIDFNRAGAPLIEVVSEPELRSAEEAGEYLRAVRQLVRFLGISDGNMDEGSLRCDANVSIRPRGSATLGQRTELKNINSFKNVQKAIDHEIARQTAILRAGGTIVAETRGWDAELGASRRQRSKEAAPDYRYFPDPDLPPLVIEPQWLAALRQALPRLPRQRREHYLQHLGLSPYDASLLTAERELCDYFDQVLAAAGVPTADGARALQASERALAKLASNWLGSELLGALHRDYRTIEQSPVSAEALAELLGFLADGVISSKQAKEVFLRMYERAERAAAVIDLLGLRQLTDAAAIAVACQAVVAAPENQPQVQKYRHNPKLLGFFVGQVLAKTGGRAKPELVNDILRRLLAAKV
jgi:aspartyl-tRNA(Asn)/glutamyl-tRNA(Gln) amidotransferase subunit B